jgi:transcriptional regulator with XRE-family HTH domain
MIQPASEPASVDIDGPEVRRRRKILGQNIAPFAGRCDISEAYLSAIELERRKKVSPEVFGRICAALGVNVKDRSELVRNRPQATTPAAS